MERLRSTPGYLVGAPYTMPAAIAFAAYRLFDRMLYIPPKDGVGQLPRCAS